jgi:hypothetical protein
VGLEYSSHPLGNVDMFQEVSPLSSHPEFSSARGAARSAMLGRPSQPQTSAQCGEAGANTGQTKQPIKQNQSNKGPRVLPVSNLTQEPRVEHTERDPGKCGCQSRSQKACTEDEADNCWCIGVLVTSVFAERQN